MILIKTISQGWIIPPFYGVVGYNWRTQETEIAIVPLNWCIVIARAVWAFLRFGTRPIAQDPRTAFMCGYYQRQDDGNM